MIRVWLSLFLAVFLGACESQRVIGDSTVRVDGATASGFLSDYSNLRPGRDGQASLVYWNPDADFGVYDALIIEPVTIWLGDDSPMNDVSAEERQKLADEFYAAIVKALEPDYRITNQASPRTMRIRVALTDAQESWPVMDTISTYVPQARLLQSVVSLASDTAGFVGEASAEAEVLDSMTGDVLVAGIDRRAGTKSVDAGTFSAWGDVRRAFDAWSTQFANNMRSMAAGSAGMASGTGGLTVELGTYFSRNETQRAGRAIAAANSDLLTAEQLRVREIPIEGGERYFALYAAGLSRDSARSLCQREQAAGGPCEFR